MKKFVGIDIPKETFDIYFEQENKGCHSCMLLAGIYV